MEAMSRKLIPGPATMPNRTIAAVAATDPGLIAEGRRVRGVQRSDMQKKKSTASQTPVLAVIERAQEMGLMTTNTQQVGARLPMKLLEHAKKRTGLNSTTDLLTFALANVAVDDNFAEAFVAARGKLDPDLDVGF